MQKLVYKPNFFCQTRQNMQYLLYKEANIAISKFDRCNCRLYTKSSDCSLYQKRIRASNLFFCLDSLSINLPNEEGKMLILTRKIEESIMIGDDIVVKVLRVMGDTVKIGIEAPRSIPIYREEIYYQKEKFEAKRSSGEKTKSPNGHIRYVSPKAELWLRPHEGDIKS